MPQAMDDRIVSTAYPSKVGVHSNINQNIDPQGDVDNNVEAVGVYKLYDSEGNFLGEKIHKTVLWSGKAVPSLDQIANAIGSATLGALKDGVEAMTGDRPA